MNSRSFLLFFLLVTAAHSGAETVGRGTLPRSVIDALKRGKAPEDSLSVYIKRMGGTQPLLDYNADTARNPASAMKVVTTYSALEMFGPTHRWSTRFYRDGPLSNGRLSGNLVIRGGGDPLLTAEGFFRALYALRERGIEHITGDLIIDNTLFDEASIDLESFDKNRYRPYNAYPDAMLVNFRVNRFMVMPEASGVKVFTDPPASTLTIDNRVKLVQGPCQGARHIGFKVVSRQPTTEVLLTGNYSKECGETAFLRSIIPQDQYLYGIFKSIWQAMGGTIDGRYRVGAKPKGAQWLYTHKSQPLTEVIRSVNKFSNNVMARQMLLSIGAKQSGQPGTPALGAVAIDRWLQKENISMPQLNIVNGAGLARQAQLSARGLGNLLEAAWLSRFSAEFEASLPLAGIDGTMRKRFRSGPLKGRVRMKTGTLKGVKAGAGFLKRKDGTVYVVVIIQNHPGVQYGIGVEVQNLLLKWLNRQ